MICGKCMKLKMVEDDGEIFYCGLYVESKNAGCRFIPVPISGHSAMEKERIER